MSKSQPDMRETKFISVRLQHETKITKMRDTMRETKITSVRLQHSYEIEVIPYNSENNDNGFD